MYLYEVLFRFYIKFCFFVGGDFNFINFYEREEYINKLKFLLIGYIIEIRYYLYY